MRKVKLELHNHKGEITSEEELVISDGDKIILQVPPKTTLEHQTKLHNGFKSLLTDSNRDVLSIPDDVKIKVLKVK